VREGFGREPPSGLELDAAGTQLCEDLLVAGGLAHGDDVDEVLRSRPQERRPADVDHLDRVLLADVPARGHALEGVEVDADEIEGADLVLAQLVQVGLERPARKDAGVNARVEGLDPPAEQLGEVGQLLDRDDVDAELGHVSGGSPARDDLDPELGESTGKDIQPGLVEDRHERATHLHA
jgi:hypothetical protein